MTRFVIHNYLPARRTTDEYHQESNFAQIRNISERLARLKARRDPDRAEITKAEGELKKLSRAEVMAHDEGDFQRFSGDVIWVTVPEDQFNKTNPGVTQITYEGRAATVIDKTIVKTQFSGTIYRLKVRLK